MTTSERERIIEKIKLIFNLAENNPSEEEAQAAVERGRALLIKYGLDMSAIETEDDDDESPFDTGHDEVEFSGKRIAEWKKSLMVVVSDYFECKCYMSHRHYKPSRVIFYGIAINVQAAKTAFASIINQIETLSKQYKITREDWYDAPNSYEFGSLKSFARTAKLEYKIGIVSGLRKQFRHVKKAERQLHGESNVTALAIRYKEAADDHLKNVLKIKLSSGSSSGSIGTGSGKHHAAGRADSSRVNATKQLG